MFSLQILQLWPSIRKRQWNVVLNTVLVNYSVLHIRQYLNNLIHNGIMNWKYVLMCVYQRNLKDIWIECESMKLTWSCFIVLLVTCLLHSFFFHFQSCMNHQMAGFSLYCLRSCFLVFLLLVHFCKHLHI